MNAVDVDRSAQPAIEAKPAANLVDGKEGEIAFPSFIVRRTEGVFADLAKLESSARFEVFVERVFSSGQFFTGLDYARFLELLYDYPPEKIAAAVKGSEASKKSTLVRFAADVTVLSPERRALYNPPRIVDGEAEYLFEPAVLERVVEEGGEKRVLSERTTLSFDEFVADMWTKGVRYGIDAHVVLKAIRGGESERAIFARPLEPTAGKDAGIEDQTDALYRDDAPRELPNGKIDLRQFKNHFPQVRKGERLLKKIPRVLGEVGWTVAGTPVEPLLPQDFDLASLVGAGTEVERVKEGEFLVATLDGFLSIDTDTNRIAVHEKIVNRSGVSARTTGDILLTCDEYEEHGEIQEKRVVEGKSITVYADVFGTIISSGGKIELKQNLIRGSALNRDGDIAIEGLVSGAVVHAKKGAVVVKRAENCVIVGKTVNIEFAVHCDILGEMVEVESAEGCAIAGKDIRIGNAGPRHESETIVSVFVPDLSSFDEKIGQLGKKIEEVDFSIVKKRREIEVVTSQPQVKNYLTLGARLKKNEITLTPEQKENWQKLVAQVAPALKMLAKLNGELKELQVGKESIDGEIAALMQSRDEASAGISCSIGNIRGDMLVRTMKIKPDAAPLADLAPKELKARLRASGLSGTRLPSGRSGAFNWQYQPANQGSDTKE